MRALILAESIKLRRHVAVWFAVGAPVMAVGLFLIVLFGQATPAKMSPDAIWRVLSRAGWSWWLMVFLPLLTVIEAAALANLEHDGRQWKQLFTSPVARWRIYGVKLLFCAGLGLVATVVFCAGLIGDVLILNLFVRLDLAMHIPWVDLVAQIGRAFLACLPMVALQSWISLRYRGFVVPVGGGLALMLIGLFLAPIRAFQIRYWYPWMLPNFTVLRPDSRLEDIQIAVAVGCVLGLLAGVVVCWDLARRENG